MRQISNKEWKEEHLPDGAGFCCFMGGTPSKNGREIIAVGAMTDHPKELWLFEEHEVGNDKWEELQYQLTRESEAYSKAIA